MTRKTIWTRLELPDWLRLRAESFRTGRSIQALSYSMLREAIDRLPAAPELPALSPEELADEPDN